MFLTKIQLVRKFTLPCENLFCLSVDQLQKQVDGLLCMNTNLWSDFENELKIIQIKTCVQFSRGLRLSRLEYCLWFFFFASENLHSLLVIYRSTLLNMCYYSFGQQLQFWLLASMNCRTSHICDQLLIATCFATYLQGFCEIYITHLSLSCQYFTSSYLT